MHNSSTGSKPQRSQRAKSAHYARIFCLTSLLFFLEGVAVFGDREQGVLGRSWEVSTLVTEGVLHAPRSSMQEMGVPGLIENLQFYDFLYSPYSLIISITYL